MCVSDRMSEFGSIIHRSVQIKSSLVYSSRFMSNQIRVPRHPSSNMGGAIGGRKLATHLVVSYLLASSQIKSNQIRVQTIRGKQHGKWTIQKNRASSGAAVR